MRILLFAPLLALAGTIAAGAAETVRPGLDAARKALADAVAAKDAKAVAALARFPLIVEVYQEPPKVTAKQFGKGHLAAYFGDGDSGIVTCIRSGPIVRNDPKEPSGEAFGKSWRADCDGNSYFFAERDGRWRFIGYQNSNE